MQKLRFEIAFYVSGDIGIRDAGVVELVDARDSKTFHNQKILANMLFFSHIYRHMH